MLTVNQCKLSQTKCTDPPPNPPSSFSSPKSHNGPLYGVKDCEGVTDSNCHTDNIEKKKKKKKTVREQFWLYMPPKYLLNKPRSEKKRQSLTFFSY